MIRETLEVLVEVTIVGPSIFFISGVIWAVWGVAQAAQSVQRWWAERRGTVAA